MLMTRLVFGVDELVVAGPRGVGFGFHIGSEEQNAAIKAKPLPVKYERVKSVHVEWIDACRAGKQAGSNFAGHAGPLTEMIALGNLAVRAGRTLELDPSTGAVKSPTIPNDWIMPAYRSGWSLTV